MQEVGTHHTVGEEYLHVIRHGIHHAVRDEEDADIHEVLLHEGAQVDERVADGGGAPDGECEEGEGEPRRLPDVLTCPPLVLVAVKEDEQHADEESAPQQAAQVVKRIERDERSHPVVAAHSDVNHEHRHGEQGDDHEVHGLPVTEVPHAVARTDACELDARQDDGVEERVEIRHVAGGGDA